MLLTSSLIAGVLAAGSLGTGSLASTGSSTSPSSSTPSVLLVTIDDLGTDQVRSYDPDADACTPVLDSLAVAGVRFTRAYANPVCSPTRAALLTGRYGMRTGVGLPINHNVPRWASGLALSELTLAKHLRANGYRTWAAGKWHLDGIEHGPDHPNLMGFESYRGDLAGAPGLRTSRSADYFDWDRTVDGHTLDDTRYCTTVTLLDAVQMMEQASGPWFGYVSWNAVHSPYHAPPSHACPPNSCGCQSAPRGKYAYPALVESVDAHLGVLIDAAVAATAGDVIVIVMGDNGTPRPIPSNKPCPRSGKGLLYEGGISVPFYVAGTGLPPGTVSDALIGVTDVFATVCELVGVGTPLEAQDSLSFRPALFGAPGVREYVYCESFGRNGLPAQLTEYRRVVVERDWKLIRRDANPVLPMEELFDLAGDPCESKNLMEEPLTGAALRAYERLNDRLFLLENGN